MTKFAQRFRLDLTDAFSRHFKSPSYFLECVRVRLPDRIATSELSVLSRSKVSSTSISCSFSKVESCCVCRSRHIVVRNKISPNGCLLLLRSVFPSETGSCASFRGFLSPFLRRFPSPPRFLRRRLSSQFLQKLARNADQFIDRLHHMHGNSDRSRLIGDRSRDRPHESTRLHKY